MKTEIAFMEVVSTHQMKELIFLSSSLFGTDYHEKNYFEHSKNEVILTASFKNKLIGFLKIIYEGGNSLKIDCIGVSKKFQRKGIATHLLSYYFEHHHSHTNDIYALAWKTSSGIHAKKLFEKFEMRAIKNLGRIWENDCENNFQCPFKLGTCNCKAILFKRDSI